MPDHPMLLGLLGELPERGGEWTAEQRGRWLQAMMHTIDFLYPIGWVEPETMPGVSERYNLNGRKRWHPTAEQVADQRLYEGEREVLALRADGLDNDDIAAQLGVSVATVKNRLVAAKKRLGVRPAAQAVPRGSDALPLLEGGAPDAPPCPICHEPDRVGIAVSKPGGWWCERCSLAFTKRGRPSEPVA